MQQKINLLEVLPKEAIVRLPAQKIWWGALVFFVLLMLYYFYGAFDNYQIAQKLKMHKVLAQTAAAQLLLLKEKYPNVANNQENKQVQDLARAIKAKQDVIAIVEKKKAELNITGFSSYLTAFGEDILPEVWLIEIHIKEGGTQFLLEGKTYSTDQLFEFIENLNNDTVFKDLQFKLGNIKKPTNPKDPVSFSIIGAKEGAL